MNGRLSIIPDTKLAIFESGAIESSKALVFVGTILFIISRVPSPIVASGAPTITIKFILR